jgi:hypothetical protein
VIRTLVPPAPGPVEGLMAVMVGARPEEPIVQVNDVDPVLAGVALSVAVTVTDEVPELVGVPVMVPFEAPIDSPAGNPVADQVMVAGGAVCESVAEAVTGVTATPTLPVWLGMEATETVLVTVQVKAAVSEAPEPSVALTVTELVLPVVGVPLIFPVELLIDSPAGSPVAE